jgi:hypothetical protein
MADVSAAWPVSCATSDCVAKRYAAAARSVERRSMVGTSGRFLIPIDFVGINTTIVPWLGERQEMEEIAGQTGTTRET